MHTIVSAIYSGDIENIKQLTSKDFDIERKFGNDQTLFHIAMVNSKLEVAKFLLKERGANINTKDEEGYTPLHCSVNEEDPKCSLFLIENGADINIKNNHGGTPLFEAVKWGNFEAVKALVGYGAVIDDSVKKAPKTVLNEDHYQEIVYFLENREAFPIDVKPAVEECE